MDNDELAIVPASVRDGDVICIFPGAVSACVLRQIGHRHWALISGDCCLFTHEYFRPKEYPDYIEVEFDCDEYIACHDKREVFIIR
jgi:hypothetical protein